MGLTKSNWDQLKQLCLECGLPEPELRRKLWVTIADIPGHMASCDPNEDVAIKQVIKWCKGYKKEQDEK